MKKSLAIILTSCLAALFLAPAAYGAGAAIPAAEEKEPPAAEVASVDITLSGTDLTYIHTHGKDEKYPGTTVTVRDPSGRRVISSDTVELKGRGNTSWTYPSKKSYQIKFDDKTDVLGLGAAKKWVLIASAFDDSLIRNQVAFHLARELGMEYVPDMTFAQLTIDGDYRGLYMLGEKVEVGEGRVDLTDPLGALVELDNFFYDENDYYFFDDYLDANAFALKEAAQDDNSLAALELFHERLDEFLDFLYSRSARAITLDELETYIDAESFASWYLVNEFCSNVEAYQTSFYWYLDGEEDRLHLGPVWDFDSCMGNKLDYSDTSLMYFRDEKLFKRLLAVPDFYELVSEIYTEHIDSFEGLGEYALALGDALGEAGERDFVRWHLTETETYKPDILTEDIASYEEAVLSLSDWLDQRFLVFSYMM